MAWRYALAVLLVVTLVLGVGACKGKDEGAAGGAGAKGAAGAPTPSGGMMGGGGGMMGGKGGPSGGMMGGGGGMMGGAKGGPMGGMGGGGMGGPMGGAAGGPMAGAGGAAAPSASPAATGPAPVSAPAVEVTGDPATLVGEAMGLKRAGSYDEASTKLEAALKQDPMNAKGLWIHAWILAEQGTTNSDTAKIGKAKDDFKAFVGVSTDARKTSEAKKALGRLARK